MNLKGAKLSYDEAQAVVTMRKALRRIGAEEQKIVLTALFEGIPREIATDALIKIKNELGTALDITRAFAGVCQKLIEMEKEKENGK